MNIKTEYGPFTAIATVERIHENGIEDMAAYLPPSVTWLTVYGRTGTGHCVEVQRMLSPDTVHDIKTWCAELAEIEMEKLHEGGDDE